MVDSPRLIEVAFPLKQASLDSVHEKNVRHGHISTLHIWPARRPLAACRAALIATLLPDPGDAEERKKILERLGGKVVQAVKRKKMPNGKIEEVVTEETVGGILHWGRESGPDLEWFRTKIREAYGGRAPKVLDPFAGGGAIPLEAMRLGCEATAIDINPVAWFILKCTLEYPQKLAGQKRPLPSFVLKDYGFMKSFFEAQGLKGAGLRTQLERLLPGENQMPPLSGLEPEGMSLEADLAWHVRAWGLWVLQQARTDLERFYPVIDGKPTVAYLWARTVSCKNCRATVPLLKTLWLCKKDKKRVVLTMEPNDDCTGVVFGIHDGVLPVGANPAQRREHDKRVGAGTMSRSGATCPCCGNIVTMEDIRLEGHAHRLGLATTAVVVDGATGKEYRISTAEETRAATEAATEIAGVFAEVPFGLLTESLPTKQALGFRLPLYGFDKWRDLFTSRQMLMLGTFVKYCRAARLNMIEQQTCNEWAEAVGSYLAIALDKLVDRESMQCIWISTNAEKASGSFGRFALPITWDFAEVMPWSASAGGFIGSLDHICEYVEHALNATQGVQSRVLKQSATKQWSSDLYDVVVTDPPYYDAISYSDLMDFYYIWLRRTLNGLAPETDTAFLEPLGPKWDIDNGDGELIDDASRHGGDAVRSKVVYEDGMFRAFNACHNSLTSEGRMVVVFAHKQPDAWETLVSAMIRAGFLVDGSWPIQTERIGRLRSQSSAALSSSVWLVCRKRVGAARPGWDNRVLEEMRENISSRLRDFWDAGIRGPDFVWAATGPALEAYSKYPAVKKANEPGQLMTVSEFLRHVRRIVVDFVVGRVLSHNGNSEGAGGLDDVTTYYLLHRHDFGMGDAPAGACILYAISCGLSDSALANQFDILVRTGGQEESGEDLEEMNPDDGGGEIEEGSGSKVRLKPWNKRKRVGIDLESPARAQERIVASMSPMLPGLEQPAAKPRDLPLIDQVHHLMHLWKAGDIIAVDDYLDARGLRRSSLFHHLLQALIELAPAGSEERSLLESISNHVSAKGSVSAAPQTRFEGV
ncbi:MAG: DUF1156 domain-containing protein [Chloroflexi bacterium]|nr:DUF1156 domain-containing protein [Chloroflexota bacterium]